MSIGFKEWALVCEALGHGKQSIILRKGGIAEGRDGFHFKHEDFYLFPTLFHEQLAKTKLPQDTPLPVLPEATIQVKYFAHAEWSELVTDPALIAKLAPYHIWKESEIEQRYQYDEVKGVNLAFVRIYRLAPEWTFPDAPKYGGCRSWLTFPDLPEGTKLEPVLDDATHTARGEALQKIIQQ